MKTHLSLTTHDLARSTAFYAALLDAEPVKKYDDYVLFIAEEPGLELALNPHSAATLDSTSHFGIAVERMEDVDKAITRLTRAGLPLDVETGEICCYARQNKVWATDPDGRRWEVYHVIEETAGDSCCSAAPS